MDYETASAIGNEGEELVSRVLRALQPQYRFRWLHGVLLKQGKKTAQIDHVLVDRHGVMLLECKVRNNALLRGTSVDKKWTACYRGGRHKSFQNPLLQNMEHESVLRYALKSAGISLPSSEYFQRAVVIVGANLDALELDSVDVPKVVDLSRLPALLKERYDFCVNAGELAEDRVEHLEGLLRSMNRSEDLDVLAEHARHARGRTAAHVATAPTADSSAGTFIPRRVSPTPVNRPDVYRAKPPVRFFAAFVWLLLVMGLFAAFASWISTPTGLNTMSHLLTRPILGSVPEEPAPAAAIVNGPPLDLALAKKSYAEAAPDKYKTTLNLDSPKRSVSGPYTTYGWDFSQRGTDGVVRVRTIYLTFEPNGRIKGVTLR